MRTFAHRGFHREVPENTFEAFDEAVKIGVDGIETDVRVSADGALVLHHDRTTPRGHPIDTLTHAQLCEELGHEVPTLQAALSAWELIVWDIEVKTPHAAEAVANVVKQYAATREVIVSSFWHAALDRYLLATDAVLGYLTASRLLDDAAYIEKSVAVPRLAAH